MEISREDMRRIVHKDIVVIQSINSDGRLRSHMNIFCNKIPAMSDPSKERWTISNRHPPNRAAIQRTVTFTTSFEVTVMMESYAISIKSRQQQNAATIKTELKPFIACMIFMLFSFLFATRFRFRNK
jgi:hypothetical protein